MEKLIRYPDLWKYAYSSEKLCRIPFRAVVVEFYGQLNSCEIIHEDPDTALYFAEHDILYVMPYTNPWSWMNRQAIAYTDEVLDVLYERFTIPSDLPMAVIGEFMGAQSALVYMAYGKRKASACAAICPPCELKTLFNDRKDIPRTLYNSLFHEPGDLSKALQAASPLYLTDKMSDSFYRIDQYDIDPELPRKKHADLFVSAMAESGHTVQYHICPGTGHCRLEPAVQNDRLNGICRVLLDC